MEHNNTNEIICPYCDYEHSDNHEYSEESAEINCHGCSKEFHYEREIEVRYSTSRIKCDDGNHNYKTDGFHIRKKAKNYLSDCWVNLPESEWKYYSVVLCDICDDKDFIEITKEQYETESKKIE